MNLKFVNKLTQTMTDNDPISWIFNDMINTEPFSTSRIACSKQCSLIFN
jgi:hypothetical protein